MLRDIRQLYGNKLSATDGDIGHVKDFYFDDKTWVVRYLVADTGTWLSGRQVLLAPHSFGAWERDREALAVALTRQQIEDSPSIESHLPVSRQYEIEYFNYYGYPTYWNGGAIWGLSGYPLVVPIPEDPAALQQGHQHRADKHLQSAKSVTGYSIHATDGEIGSVSGFMVDDKSWAVGDLTVEAGHWYSGKEILVPTAKIARISYEDSQVYVTLAKTDIESAAEHHVAKAGT